MEQTPLTHTVSPDLPNIQFEPLMVACRHSKSRIKLLNQLWQWLVCWPDPYEASILPLLWAIYGIILMLLDMASDLYVARTHFEEGHKIWSYLTLVFFFLPMVFALGYYVVLRRFHSWYQVHPIGPFYWSIKVIQAQGRQRNFQVVRTPEDATSFVHYTHEIIRCDKRCRYASADESYLEAFPECILQAYFIARLWSNVNGGLGKESDDEITLGMWLSVVMSAVSLVGFESTVAYNRHFVSAVFEPSTCDIVVRIILDLMCVLPRLAAIACYLTVEPREITVTCFLAAHVIVFYLWLIFSDRNKQRVPHDDESESSFEEYRGYKKNRSTFINHLRATLVSFLLPPTCSWHLHDAAEEHPAVRKPFSLREVCRGLPYKFWAISVFQLVESMILFGVWVFYNQYYTGHLPLILVPTVSLLFLLVRPICDVLCQMLFLTPLAQDEAINCVRFRGMVAKTRILELGSDIVNSLAAEVLPRLHNLELLLGIPFTDTSRTVVKRECNYICVNFTPEKIIKRYSKQRSHAKVPEINQVATSPGPKTENLLHEVGQADMELLQKIVSAARTWEVLNDTADHCAEQLRDLIAQCQDRIGLWEQVFVLCLNHARLPSHFYKESEDTDGNTIYADYSKLILLNKAGRHKFPSVASDTSNA